MPDGAGYVQLDALDLAIAAALVLIAGAVSMAMRLKLERRLAIASLRTIVQLLLVGYVLKLVFDLDSLLPVLGVAVLMVGTASFEAVRRPARTFKGVTWRAFLTLLASALLTTVTVTALVVGVDPWFEPQYLIPLLGMALGNGLTGISLCLDQFLQVLVDRRAEVEMELAHGATRWEAARAPLQEAVRRGMIPIINSMSVVGIVSLPGMMTGQILARADPVDAVKYQIVVMFLLAASTALGCMSLALLAYRRLFNERHQLRSDLIADRRGRHD